jgi:hypothetical protein
MDDTVPYFVRVLDKVHYRPGAWQGLRVGVFRRENGIDVQVGEYERNYPSLFRTFAPFRVAERELALYSPDYTCTRLLELPSCRDIGGEEPEGNGFCPVDFFVPYFVDSEYRVDDQPPRRFRKQMPAADDLVARTITRTLPRPFNAQSESNIRTTRPSGDSRTTPSVSSRDAYGAMTVHGSCSTSICPMPRVASCGARSGSATSSCLTACRSRRRWI